MKLAEVETSLEELRLDGSSERQRQNAEESANTLKQIKEERDALGSSRKLLEELLLKATEEAILKAASKTQSSSTHTTFGRLGKGFQIVINNAPISGIYF